MTEMLQVEQCDLCHGSGINKLDQLWPDYPPPCRICGGTGRLAAIPQPSAPDLAEAANNLLDRMTSTYRARNGRAVGIEADDGEKCWIVHSDDIEQLRAALASAPDDTADKLARRMGAKFVPHDFDAEEGLVERVARILSEAGGAASWDHAVVCARLVVAAIPERTAEQGEFQPGDRVSKIEGYPFGNGDAVVLAAYRCAEGKGPWRYVVEHPEGWQHIFSGKQLARAHIQESDDGR